MIQKLISSTLNKKNLSAFSVCLFFTSAVQGQLIFSEPFDEAANAMTGTDNTGGVGWTTVCPTCLSGDHYWVAGGQLEGQDTNGPATWETGAIDISSCPFIEIGFTLSEQGTMEACGSGCNSVDWVQFQYNIDGSGWQSPSNSFLCSGGCAGINVIQADDITTGSMTYSAGCMPGGNSIQLRIVVQAWAADEFWRIDNVSLSCTNGPSVDAGTDQSVCAGDPVTLTAGNPDGALISWDNGITDGVSFLPVAGTTTYTVTATEGVCSNTDQVDVTATEITFSLSSSDITSCSGPADGQILISGLNPSTDYIISYNDGSVQGPFTLTSDGSGIIALSNLQAGTYTDFLAELSGCTGQDASVINILAPAIPSVDAGTDQTVCEGTAVTLTASNPDGVSLAWSDGVTDGIAFIPAVGSINYTVTATDISTDCFSTDVVNVTVIDVPVVDVDPAGPFSTSSGNQILNASPAGGTWSADCGTCIHTTTGEFDPAAAGNGTWEICYTAGTVPCTQSDCIFITVTAGCLLSGTITANDPTCFGFNDGSVTMNITGATGTPVFTITDASGSVVNTGNSNTANNLSEGWYYFNVTDDAACTFIDSVLIDDPGVMTVDLEIQNPLCYNIANGFAFADTVYNYTGSYNLVSYFWSPNPSGLNGIGEDSLVNIGAGSYNLLINDQNGCSASFDFEIEYPDSLYLVQFGSDPAYCRLFGYQSGNGVVYAAASGGTPDYAYVWTNLTTGATSSSTTWGGLNPGAYQIAVTDDNGCLLTRTITVDSLNPIADFTLTSPHLSATYEGNAVVEVHLENQSMYYANPNDPNADTAFFWHFGFTGDPWILSEDVTESFDITYATGGEYTICLVAVNKNGCTDTSCVLVTVYDALAFTPVNIFTPDGDGMNDLFTFDERAQSVEDFNCVIVDRWGIKMYEMNAIADSWDGTDKGGKACPSGVYFYYYELTSFNGIEMKGQGTVQLLRTE